MRNALYLTAAAIDVAIAAVEATAAIAARLRGGKRSEKIRNDKGGYVYQG